MNIDYRSCHFWEQSEINCINRLKEDLELIETSAYVFNLFGAN